MGHLKQAQLIGQYPTPTQSEIDIIHTIITYQTAQSTFTNLNAVLYQITAKAPIHVLLTPQKLTELMTLSDCQLQLLERDLRITPAPLTKDGLQRLIGTHMRAYVQQSMSHKLASLFAKKKNDTQVTPEPSGVSCYRCNVM